MLLLLIALRLPSADGLAEVSGENLPTMTPIVKPNVANCDANSGFQPTATGGDGAVVQYCV